MTTDQLTSKPQMGDTPNEPRGRYVDIVVAVIVLLLMAATSIAIQQIVFRNFVHEVGGRPDGLFKTAKGAHYELWSLTVPFWCSTAVMAVAGIAWAARFRQRRHPIAVIVIWLVYVVVVWSLTVASSGLVEILGKGETFV